MNNSWIEITSNQNSHYKKWKKLQTRKGRKEHQSYLIEGEHLVQEAIRAGADIQALIAEEGLQGKFDLLVGDQLDSVSRIALSSELFHQLVETESPQGMMAVVSYQKWDEEKLLAQEESTFLLLDEVQDPGNLGTLLRTAQGAGVTAVYLGHGTVDVYNPKVVRASMGALFHLPIFPRNLSKAIEQLKERAIPIVGTSPHAGLNHFDYSFPKQIATLLGNEGRGVNSEFAKLADVELKIPMPGNTESLNVSVTGAILMYERVRQMYMKSKSEH